MIGDITERWRLAAWVLVLFVATLFLHTRHNDFAWYYHPDEPGKVEQVLGMRKWNFHHPMLLLGTTQAAAVLTGARGEQEVAEIGRTVSASLNALAIVALSLIAFRWKGWIASIATGASLLLHHQLFELSHYFKEDPALLLGIAFTFLWAYLHERGPSLATALALGGSCGLAVSGKYLGAIALLIALPVLIRHRRDGTTTAATVGFIAVFLLVNFRIFSDWGTFTSSFARETKLVVEGQGQVTQSVPHTRYWSVFLANTTPVAWVLLLVLFRSCYLRRKELSLVEWMMVAFPFVYAVALSFSPKDNDRYFLPATGLFTMLAAIGASELAMLAGRRTSRLSVASVAALALILSQLPSWTDDRGGLVRYYSAFLRDDTAELVRWLRENVPANEAIAKDEKVRLPTRGRQGDGDGAQPLPNLILSDDHLPDLGTLDELRKRGVTHVIITASTYGKFAREGIRPKAKDAADFERRKAFYASLRRDFEPVKIWPRSTVLYLHPGLEVYRIVP